MTLAPSCLRRSGFALNASASTLLLILASSCGKDEPADSDDSLWSGDSPVETALDDTGEGLLLQDLQVEISPTIPTVARVTWVTSEPTSGFVRFGEAGVLSMTTPVTEGTHHQQDLVGLLPESDYAFEVTVSLGDQTVSLGEQAFTTGALSGDLPSSELTSYDPEASAGGFTIVPVQSTGRCLTTVLDDQGRTVWAHEIPCITHRTRLAPDGSGFVSHSRVGPHDPVILSHVSFFGETIEEIAIEDSHHDFAIVDTDTYAVLSYTERSFGFDGGEEVRLVGDTIVEVNAEGETSVIWDLFDHVDPRYEEVRQLSDWSEGAYDWSHSNYITYVPEEDAYYVSSRSLSALFKVDRSTGAHLWTLADNRGDFEVDEDPTLVSTPHSIEPVDGGLMLFNHRDIEAGECSQAVRASLDSDLGTAERTWSYESFDCLGVDYLGNAWPLPNGNTLVVFSMRGQMEEVTPEGRVVMRLNIDLGWWFSYATRVESLFVGAAG